MSTLAIANEAERFSRCSNPEDLPESLCLFCRHTFVAPTMEALEDLEQKHVCLQRHSPVPAVTLARVALPKLAPSAAAPPAPARDSFRFSDMVPPGLGRTKAKLRVLMLEDDPDDVELVSLALKQEGFEIDRDVAVTEQTFSDKLRSKEYDIILADYNLPQWTGLDAIRLLRKRELDIPLILVTGSLGELLAVECIKGGAADYVLKNQLARLPSVVWRALQEKRLREEFKQAQQELVRSNRDLEQFAYVASHDLQEPLRMVATFTQLLAERYREKLDDEGLRFIEYACDGAARMQDLIKDLLAFARVGRQGLNAAEVDCNALVTQAVQNLEAAIHESGAVITCHSLPVVKADGPLLLQVFQNLIGNAIKFRGSERPAIQVNASELPGEWVFSVADNGIGISSEYNDTIFVIFKRLHTHAEHPGNGLGLAICKKIIEQHGGRIWIESELGAGSTFKFSLPKTPPAGRP